MCGVADCSVMHHDDVASLSAGRASCCPSSPPRARRRWTSCGGTHWRAAARRRWPRPRDPLRRRTRRPRPSTSSSIVAAMRTHPVASTTMWSSTSMPVPPIVTRRSDVDDVRQTVGADDALVDGVHRQPERGHRRTVADAAVDQHAQRPAPVCSKGDRISPNIAPGTADAPAITTNRSGEIVRQQVIDGDQAGARGARARPTRCARADDGLGRQRRWGRAAASANRRGPTAPARRRWPTPAGSVQLSRVTVVALMRVANGGGSGRRATG